MGGDSYGWLTFGTENAEQRNDVEVRLKHQGEYHLENVRVVLICLTELSMWEKDVGTLLKVPGDQYLLRMSLPMNANKARYAAFIYARNGFIHKDIGLKRIDGRWFFATEVYRGLNTQGKLLRKAVPDGIDLSEWYDREA